MTDDDLRNRLAAANPTPSSEPVDPITSDRARALMEDIIMTTSTKDPHVQPRSYRLIGAVAAALVVVVGGAALFGGLGTSGAPLVLTANGNDSMAMCLPFDVGTLSGMSPAFGGTVI